MGEEEAEAEKLAVKGEAIGHKLFELPPIQPEYLFLKFSH